MVIFVNGSFGVGKTTVARNEAYLRELVTKTRGIDVDTFHFCLVAPLAVVQQRLQHRAGRRGPTAWQLRRAAECCSEHQRPQFAVHVSTDNRSPLEIADEMLARIRSHPLQMARV